MKRNTIALIFIMATLFPIQAQAFFTTMIEGSTSVANNIVDSSQSSTSEMIALTSKLSDDIGIMSDRILLMADNIDAMADKIGVMADRIVTTEELMTSTLIRMEEIAAGHNITTQNSAILLQTPYGSNATYFEAPNIVLSNNADNYLLYVSDTPRIDAVSQSSVMINDVNTLNAIWADLVANDNDNKVYIAVKTIDGDSLSDISNAVLINLN